MTTTRPCSSSPAVSRLIQAHFPWLGRRILVEVALLILFSAGMQAQTAHFGYALSTLGEGFGFANPTYVALDASGNLYMTDEGTAAVYELTAASGYSTVRTLSTAFTIPTGIAVDASGNVFVTDQGTATVNELTAASNYATVIPLGSGFSNPNGVAVDANGNVFVADTLNNAIKEILAVSGSIPANPTINTLGGSYNHPTSVAVDSSGNVFVADLFNSAVKEILAMGGYTTVNTLGSGFSYPAGVALDADDNVYVADSGHGSIKEILATGGYTTVNTLVASLPYSAGVVVNNSGNVFIASFSGSAAYELTLHGGIGFGSAPVATATPQTIPITFIFDTGGTIGAPAVLTQGVSGLDFTDAGTGTCTTNGTSHSYDTGDSCTVAVTFTPRYSGVRYGAVMLSNGDGTPIAFAYVSGTGVGPQVSFSPAVLTTLTAGFNYPNGIAIDGSGNIYVADQNNNAIKKILASGGYATVNTLGTGFSGPVGVAVDGSGNVFVADTGHSLIKEILAGGGYTVINTLGSGFSSPNGIAVDGNGNVFVADTVNGAVKEIPIASGYSTVITLATGFSYLVGIAVDSSGNVFVSDIDTNLISEIVAAGGYSTVRTIGSGFNEPAGAALDGQGNLFVSDFGHNAIKEILVAGGYTTINTVGSGLDGPIGVAVDGAGNVYLADSVTNTVKQLNVVTPPALSFATTPVGSTSSDSPKAVTLVNNGNASLTFEVPGTGLNPSLSTGFTFGNSSTCPQVSSSSSPATLAAGDACLGNVSFTPTAAGSITGAMVITDNALNAAGPTYAAQSIALSGTAIAPLTATTAMTSVALTRNFAVMAFVPVTGSGGTGTLTYSILPALPAGLNFSSATGMVSGTPTAVSPATTYTVTVTDSSEATSSATFSLTVNAAVAAATAVASRTLTRNHAAAAYVPVTGSGGTGTLTYGVSPELPASLSFSAATGAVSGTPTAVSAATTYTVTITDSNGATSSATFSLAVNGAVVASTAISSSVLIQNRVATPFVPVTGSGGTGALTYSISPTLPAGLSLSSSTGSVSGTPASASAAATYTVTVTDSNGAAASAAFSLTVNSLIATATVVSASNLTPSLGTSVVLTATVTPASLDVPPGTVNFYDGGTLLGASALTTAGMATLSVTLPQGPNGITAVYSGSARYAGSTSSALSVSALAATSITFSASPTTQLYNNPIGLTAQVSSPTAGILTGTVSFLDGTMVIATATVATNGQASSSVTSLAQGSHSLTAVYSGDGDFQTSTSTGTGIAITVGNINLNLGNDENQSVIPGGTASYTFPLSPLVTPTFLYQVQLTATGLPPGATYTFSPASIPAGSSSLPVTLTVQTAKGTASLSPPAPGGSQNSSRVALAFGLILPLFGLKRVRQRLRAIPRPIAVVLIAVMGLWATLALNGCGAGGFFGRTSSSGSYTITVTATSADLVRTSTVQLTIQ